MKLSIRQYAEALLELEREGNAKEIGERFFAWLSRRGEGKMFRNIVAEAERIARLRSGVTDVEIVTAHEADAETKSFLKSKAEKIFPGKRVEAKFSIDPSLLGGVKIQSDERLYDASLRTSVRKMKENLIR